MSRGAGCICTLYPRAGLGGQTLHAIALPASSCLSLPTPSPYPALASWALPAPANGEPYAAGTRRRPEPGLARGPGAGRGARTLIPLDAIGISPGECCPESTSPPALSRLVSRLFMKAPFVSASSHSRVRGRSPSATLRGREAGPRCVLPGVSVLISLVL